MSFSNTTTYSSYTGNDVDTTFTVQFYYTIGDTQFIDVSTYDITDPLAPVKDGVPPTYTIDESFYPNTHIVFDDPLPSDREVVIARVTDTGQPSVFVTGPFPAVSSEYTYDYLAQKIQENYAALENAGLQDFWDDVGAVGSPIYNIVNNIVTNIASENVVIVTDPTYTASAQEIVILNGAGATNVALPDPSVDAEQIVIKVGTDFANKTVSSTTGNIDGFGASYTFTSDFESKKFVYASGTWYII